MSGKTSLLDRLFRFYRPRDHAQAKRRSAQTLLDRQLDAALKLAARSPYLL